MQNPAVHWHEGLFLRPHHLQAWDRHWEEKTTAAHRWSNPHDYGIASIQICSDALAAGFFQVNSIRCKMPEGSLIEINPGEATQRRDLREALTLADQPSSSSRPACVDVFLAVSRLQLGTANVAEPRLYRPSDTDAVPGMDMGNSPSSGATSSGATSNEPTELNVDNSAAGGDRRFESMQMQLHDEVDASSVEPILVRRINARLMLSTEDTSGYETIRIARVLRGIDGRDIARLDERIIPPVLQAGGSHVFRNDILSRLHDRLQHRVEMLRDWMNQGGLTSGVLALSDLRQIMLLQTLQQSAAVVDALKRSKGIHPEKIYLELARICGSLEWISPEGTAPTMPAYDHEDLGGVMHLLMRRIETRIQGIGRRSYQQRFMVASGSGAHVAIDEAWIQRDQALILGVRRIDLTASQLERLLLAGELDCKWGSQRQVDGLFRQRVAGVQLQPTQHDCSQLPASEQWSYFDILDAGPAWEDIKLTKTLAVRFREESIQASGDSTSSDPASSGESDPHTVALDTSQGLAELQFAIFAMPRAKS